MARLSSNFLVDKNLTQSTALSLFCYRFLTDIPSFSEAGRAMALYGPSTSKKTQCSVDITYCPVPESNVCNNAEVLARKQTSV